MTRSLLLLVTLISGCTTGPLRPVSIDTRNDTCAYCRMVVSDPRMAAQIVAAGDEARVFDDIGCLRDYLARQGLPREATVFVADHRSGKWVEATHAVYTISTGRRTPMASGIVAHVNRASRDADPAAAGGIDIPVQAILGGAEPPQRSGA